MGGSPKHDLGGLPDMAVHRPLSKKEVEDFQKGGHADQKLVALGTLLLCSSPVEDTSPKTRDGLGVWDGPKKPTSRSSKQPQVVSPEIWAAFVGTFVFG